MSVRMWCRGVHACNQSPSNSHRDSEVYIVSKDVVQKGACNYASMNHTHTKQFTQS
jgi:hypothetical protein